MTTGQKSLESASLEIDNLQKVIKRQSSNQVTSGDEKQIIKATAYSWFQNHRTPVADVLGDDNIKHVDGLYRSLLAFASRSTTRAKYFATIKAINKGLNSLQAEHVISLTTSSPSGTTLTSDAAPQFRPLIADPKMQAILRKRWEECATCVGSKAPLAATVMMGGLLEGLLLAKVNQLSDKSVVFKSASAPIDPKTGKAYPLKDWGLKNFIDVAHELGWISKATKDIGEVVRDYRNYIHPQKELSHGIVLEATDAQMLWEVAKSITLQIVNP